MRLPFRFHRGELNGFYLKRLLVCANIMITEVLDELAYLGLCAWQTTDTGTRIAMRASDFFGIGAIAGIFVPVVFNDTNNGSLKFTTSTVINGVERSERGLWDYVLEMFVFFHTAGDEYVDDITVEATDRYRASFVPAGTVPVGYIAYGTDLYTSNGTIIPENILPTPPTDGTPYTNYYGEKYLHLEEIFHTDSYMPLEVYVKYHEAMMRIRRSGISILAILEMADIFCHGHVKDIEVEQIDSYYVLHYTRDYNVFFENRTGYFSAWQYVFEQKFRNFILVEND